MNYFGDFSLQTDEHIVQIQLIVWTQIKEYHWHQPGMLFKRWF